MVELEEGVRRVRDALEGAAIPHAFIGGLGRFAWGSVRVTTDVDVQVAVDPAGWLRCRAALASAGFALDREYGESGPPPDNARFFDQQGLRLDVMTAKTPFQEDVVRRAVVREVLGQRLRVETAEDLVIYKLIAGRRRTGMTSKTWLGVERSRAWPSTGNTSSTMPSHGGCWMP